MLFSKKSTIQAVEPTQSLTVHFLGGHPEIKPNYGKLDFYLDKIVFIRRKKILLTLPSGKIASYTVEGKEDISRRITATRMVTLGIFALATPKKNVKREQYLTIVLKDGNQLIFEHTNQFINEAMFRGLVSTAFAKMLSRATR
jgi:hypothetical protein